VLLDGESLRLHYCGLPIPSAAPGAEVTSVAEIRDGVHWTRPELGLFEVNGSKANNVMLAKHGACQTPHLSSTLALTARLIGSQRQHAICLGRFWCRQPIMDQLLDVGSLGKRNDRSGQRMCLRPWYNSGAMILQNEHTIKNFIIRIPSGQLLDERK